MQTTPVKAELNTSCFTPIRFNDSPKNKTPDKLAIHTRLAQIVKTLQENQIKWEAAQRRGASLCLAIEGLKTPALESKSDPGPLYPTEMKTHCDKLQIVTGICGDILVSARQSLQQLEALQKLSGKSPEVQYKSWTIDHFIKLAELAVLMYEREVANKRKTSEEIAHSTHRSELILHSSAWEFPSFADEELRLCFKFMSAETDPS